MADLTEAQKNAADKVLENAARELKSLGLACVLALGEIDGWSAGSMIRGGPATTAYLVDRFLPEAQREKLKRMPANVVEDIP